MPNKSVVVLYIVRQGFEIGSGFSGTRQRGSAHNDAFVQKGDRLGTKTNNSGGIQVKPLAR